MTHILPGMRRDAAALFARLLDATTYLDDVKSRYPCSWLAPVVVFQLCGVQAALMCVPPYGLLLVPPCRRKTEWRMDHGVRMKQVIEGVPLTRISRSEPAEHDRLPRICHLGSLALAR